MSVSNEQRYTQHRPCPVCGGHRFLPSGKGVRCMGFTSSDGTYAHCSRPEKAGNLEPEQKPAGVTFAHRLVGDCKCGETHGAPALAALSPRAWGERPDPNAKPPAVPFPLANGLPPIEFFEFPFPGRRRKPEAIWPFLSSDGAHVLLIEARYVWFEKDPESGEEVRRKESRPWTWKGTEWQHNAVGAFPRPLYGLEQLSARPDAPVLLAEGCRKAEPARDLFPDHVCVAPAFGKDGLKQADLHALRGRDVTLWPDADVGPDTSEQSFRAAVPRFTEAGARSVSIVDVAGLPPKWDLADPLPPDFTVEELRVRLDQAEKLVDAAELPEIQEDARPPKFRLLKFADLAALPPPTWLIDGILPAEAFAVLFGESGAGKSFMALDMALSVSQGMTWGDRSTAAGGVVYVAGEGVQGLLKRAKAWMIARGLGNDPTLLEHIGLVDTAPNLRDPNDTTSIGELIQASADTLGAPVSLIIFDTLARCIVGGDENSAQDMGVLVNSVDQLRRQFNATTVLVHHTGKGDTRSMRGSSALKGASDVVLRLEKAEAGVQLFADKLKDSEDGWSEEWAKRYIETADSLALAKREAGAGEAKRARDPEARLTPQRKDVLRALREICSEKAEVGVREIVRWLNQARDEDERIAESSVHKSLAHLVNAGLAHRNSDTAKYQPARSPVFTERSPDEANRGVHCSPPFTTPLGGERVNGGQDADPFEGYGEYEWSPEDDR